MSHSHRPYWVHSQPDPEPDDRPDVVDRLCPTLACNRAYLRAATAAAAELQAAHLEGDRDEDRAIVEHGVKPTGGQPYWCATCRDRITKALGRLPDLAAAVHVVGAEPPHVLRRVVARAPVELAGVTDTVPTAAGHGVRVVAQPRWWRDTLDCRHTVTYPAPIEPEHLRRLPGIRRCAACLVGAGRDTGSSQVGAGRIAPSSADTDATRHGTRTGSPSGSPALDMVDYVAAWAGDWVDELAEHLDHATRSAKGVRPRMTHLSQHVAYLTTHVTALLAAEQLALRVGTEVLDVVGLLERAAGEERLRHRLPAPCPRCERKSLVRDDGSEQVDCLACHVSWPESDYRRLTLVLADDLQAAPYERKPLGQSADGYGGRA